LEFSTYLPQSISGKNSPDRLKAYKTKMLKKPKMKSPSTLLVEEANLSLE